MKIIAVQHQRPPRSHQIRRDFSNEITAPSSMNTTTSTLSSPSPSSLNNRFINGNQNGNQLHPSSMSSTNNHHLDLNGGGGGPIHNSTSNFNSRYLPYHVRGSSQYPNQRNNKNEQQIPGIPSPLTQGGYNQWNPKQSSSLQSDFLYNSFGCNPSAAAAAAAAYFSSNSVAAALLNNAAAMMGSQSTNNNESFNNILSFPGLNNNNNNTTNNNSSNSAFKNVKSLIESNQSSTSMNLSNIGNLSTASSGYSTATETAIHNSSSSSSSSSASSCSSHRDFSTASIKQEESSSPIKEEVEVDQKSQLLDDETEEQCELNSQNERKHTTNGALANNKSVNNSASLAHIMDWIKAPPSSMKSFDEITTRLLTATIKWANTQKSFLSLPFNDQVLLIEESLPELFILQMAESKSDIFNENVENEENDEKRRTMQSFQEILQKFSVVKADLMEFYLLKSIILFKAGI
jgi:hypothetical protein